MSRSRKKPFVTLTKAWDKFKEHKFRQKTKKQLKEMEIEWDADKDWEEYNYKKMGEWGTRLGFKVDLDPDDSWFNYCEEMKRK